MQSIDNKDLTFFSMLLSAFVDNPLDVFDNVGDYDEEEQKEIIDYGARLLGKMRAEGQFRGVKMY